jgi:bifunctional non-homologous end joining protein LigD
LVTKVNDKRSVQLALIDTLGRKVPSGNVTIPSNRNIPKPGDICEVKYLYAFRSSGSVFQPVWLGLREDLIPEDCSTLQIKYKSEPEESDEL